LQYSSIGKHRFFPNRISLFKILCGSEDCIKTGFEFQGIENIKSKINLFYLQHSKILMGYSQNSRDKMKI
jgi:hypothetical protein